MACVTSRIGAPCPAGRVARTQAAPRLPSFTPRPQLGPSGAPGGRVRYATVPRTASLVAQAGLRDTVAALWGGMENIMDFESWAPRSSRAWRLREVPNEVSVKGAKEAAEREDRVLQAALRGELTAEEGASAGFEGIETVSRFRQTIEEAMERMDSEDGTALTGLSLAEMCYSKYSRYHDMSIKHVTMNKGKTRRWVALNIYVGYLGQRTFPYNEEEYIEKLDSIATMLNAWDQVDYVSDFFAEPPIPRRGLPSRPRVDTAVSLRLNASPNWDDSLADEFFTY